MGCCTYGAAVSNFVLPNWKRQRIAAAIDHNELSSVPSKMLVPKVRPLSSRPPMLITAFKNMQLLCYDMLLQAGLELGPSQRCRIRTVWPASCIAAVQPRVGEGRIQNARAGLLIACPMGLCTACLHLQVWYFCSGSSGVFLLPYLFVFLQQHGLSDEQLGWVSFSRPLVSAAANMAVPAFADRFNCHKTVVSTGPASRWHYLRTCCNSTSHVCHVQYLHVAAMAARPCLWNAHADPSSQDCTALLDACTACRSSCCSAYLLS